MVTWAQISKSSKNITTMLTNKRVIRSVVYRMLGIRLIFLIKEFLMNNKIFSSEIVVITMSMSEYKALRRATA